MSKNILFIGPASVGKTTIGRLLADRIQWPFIDIDEEFCKRIDLIPRYVKQKGYAAYCKANSQLTERLLQENPKKSVFATPSGFLAHEECPDIVKKHEELIKNFTSILLLPGIDPHVVVNEIVKRQINRWNDVDQETEQTRFLTRFKKYQNYGDFQIYSLESPETIVSQLLEKLSK